MSQSLFYWNPFCNITEEIPLNKINESQSLFYWNPFCNLRLGQKPPLSDEQVAILILLESFLQLLEGSEVVEQEEVSQSLFYWNPFCNILLIKKKN